MASKRFYAYYVRGGQIAIIEHDNVIGSGQTLGQPSLDDIGPSGTLSWKSPVESITDGIEIEYAYSPRYTLAADDLYGVNIPGRTKLVSAGWTVDQYGFLLFLVASETLSTDPPVLSGTASSWGNVLDDNEYFLVRDCNTARWNGVHKVQDLNSYGVIQTYTKVGGEKYDVGLISTTQGDVNVNSSSELTGDNASDVWMNAIFSVGDYAFLMEAGSGDDGLYKVTAVTETDGGLEATQSATIGTKYFLNAEDGIDEFQTGDAHFGTDLSLSVYKAKYEPSHILSGVNVLDNELDTIDLPEYLSKALVYYVKSKVAEDAMDLEQKEYYMREFQRILEKHESSKMWGPRMMIPGSHGIR